MGRASHRKHKVRILAGRCRNKCRHQMHARSSFEKKTSGFFNDRSRSCPLYDTNVSKLFFDVCASLTRLYVSGFGDEIHGSFRPSPPPQIDLWRAAQVLARKCHPKVEIEKKKTGLTTNWRRRFERGPRSARTKSTEATAAESWSR